MATQIDLVRCRQCGAGARAGGDADTDTLENARLAVGALSRRATAVTAFVEAYRQFSESPSVAIARFGAWPIPNWAARRSRSS